MPLSFSLNEGIGVLAAVGEADFEQALQEIYRGMDEIEAAGVPPVLLFDLSRSAANRSQEELQITVAAIHERLPDARIALLAKGDFYYGISRMFGSFAQSFELETKIFRDLDEALAWCRAESEVTP